MHRPRMLEKHTIDQRREARAKVTSAKRKSELGQFMTPSVIAEFMADMFAPLSKRNIRLLDAGAGIGSLTAAFAQRAAEEKCKSLECDAWELDDLLRLDLQATLDESGSAAAKAGAQFGAEINGGDFILDFPNLFSLKKFKRPTHAILNPPYKKINSASLHRSALRNLGIETANLYSAFVALALKYLADGGELVAITPRSFCNGPYFKPFRELILHQSALVQIHLFASRTQAFKSDEVLQENVIFHLIKGAPQGKVILSTSEDATFSNVVKRQVDFSEIVLPDDPQKIFHLVAEVDSEATTTGMSLYRHTLEQIGLAVSTGPVVDFRLREHLRKEAGESNAPLIYAHHFENGFIKHPKTEAKKPNFIERNEDTNKWMMPTGFYSVVRRLSSKEERRRIVPAVFDPEKVHGDKIGFENHLNVFHSKKNGLTREVAKGLALYLGSTFADQWLRRFSGHTQVNAGDLRAMRYPDAITLKKWGAAIGDFLPSQEQIDLIVEGEK
jgi:adenine-specific DNA-methyltransferase